MKKCYVLLSTLLLAACGGNGSGSSPTDTTPVDLPPAEETALTQEAFAFLDPNPLADNRFGIRTVELSNGNIAIRSRGFSVGSGAGAVHLYNPLSKERIKSFYGTELNEEFGIVLKALHNGNLVIASPYKHAGGVSDSGSVMLVNGETGEQIGAPISGDNANDRIGLSITALSNGNFVIASRYDTDSVNNLNQAGSIMLINGSTGAQIGNTLYGDNDFDNIGDRIRELSNGNFVVASPQADVGVFSGVGSVFLVDGTTGAQIGNTIEGNHNGDLLGNPGVYALENGNYVIAAMYDDIDDGMGGTLTDAGSATLVSGTTGVQISVVTGDQSGDKIAQNGALSLANNEFLVASSSDSVGGNTNAGSVRFYNADTGVQIGPTYSGSGVDDYYGTGSKFQMSNGNIVISSQFANFSATDSGRVDLINGSTKNLISIQSAFESEGRFGSSGVRDLKNGNFAVVSENEDNLGSANVGSIRVFDGTTGAQVGSTTFGDNAGDQLGSSGVKVLENGHFTVASELDDINGILNAGSVTLFDGGTGTQIGSSLSGATANDEFGSEGVTVLNGNNHYVIASSKVDANGLADVGSVTLVNGDTGTKIGASTTGDDAGDLLGKSGGFADPNIIALANGDYLIVNISNSDNGNSDVGKVLYRLGQ